MRPLTRTEINKARQRISELDRESRSLARVRRYFKLRTEIAVEQDFIVQAEAALRRLETLSAAANPAAAL